MPAGGLLVCNHLTYLDVIVLSSISPCLFIAKRDVSGWPLFGWLTSAAGTVFVDRERPLASGGAVDRVRAAIDSGLPVVLFAEGTSSDGSQVLPFKSSLFEAAVRLKCPVAAARISYELRDGSAAAEVCYWGDMIFVPHLLHLFSKRTILAEVRFSEGRPRPGTRKEIARELQEEVAGLRVSGCGAGTGTDGWR